jgi:hypothetical protein
MKLAIGSFLILLLTTSLTAPTYAQDNSPSATEQSRRHFEASKALYNLGLYQEAIEELDSAYKLAPLSAFFYNLGLAHRRIGSLDKAKEYFTRFIEEQKRSGEPSGENLLKDAEQQIIDLDTLIASPDDRTLLAKEVDFTKEEKKRGLKKLLDPKRGLLIIRSKPHTVRLILNGGAVVGGLTPYVDYLNPGKYVIEISADGYEPYVQEVSIDVKKPQLVVANLLSKKALLTVLTEQDQTIIRLDGTVLGKGNKVGPVEIEPGTRRLEVSKSGFKTYTRQISLNPGEKKNLDVSLKENSFLLSKTFKYTITGASAVTVLAGGVFGLVAQAKTNQANDLIEANAAFNDELATVIEQGEIAEKRQIAFLIAGGIGLAVSGTFVLVSRRWSKSKEKATSVDLMISPSVNTMLRLNY